MSRSRVRYIVVFGLSVSLIFTIALSTVWRQTRSGRTWKNWWDNRRTSLRARINIGRIARRMRIRRRVGSH